MGTTVNHVVAKGTIDTSQINGGATTGAIVGANAGGTISNTLNMISNVSASAGLTGIYAGPTTNTNVLDTVPNAATSGAKVVNVDQVNQLISDWKIKTFADTTGDSSKDTTDADTNTNDLVDYTTLDGATSNRATAYANISKLLPFYDAATIVDYGNKVATTDRLYTTQVTAVVPLAGDTPVGLTSANAKAITQILIHYADGSVEKRAVQAVGLYKDSSVYEYQLADCLLFTSEQLMTDRSSLAQDLATEFKKINFDSSEMQEAVKLADANKGRDANAQYKMDDLFWKSSFNTVKANMDSILEQILSNDTVLGNSDQITQATKQKLLAKKAQVLVGLSYLARLYDIHFDNFSLKNILTYRPDFYGQKQDVVDWLASFGDLSFKDLQVMNNEATYAKQVAPITKSKTLTDFLEAQRASFAPDKSINDWYKSASKASVIEVASVKNPSADVSHV